MTEQEKCRTCENCKFRHELWWFEDYPKGKQSGWCCTYLKDTGGDVVMQLYSLDGTCECWDEK